MGTDPEHRVIHPSYVDPTDVEANKQVRDDAAVEWADRKREAKEEEWERQHED